MRSILDELDPLLSRVVPRALRVPLHFASLRLARRGEQSMVARLHELCPRFGRALDIGANHGLYTFALTRWAERVDAFEPQAACAANLRAYAATFADNLVVHDVALSDSSARAVLSVPWFAGRLGRAKLSGHASLDVPFDSFEAISVACKRLDDFNFPDVSFIKIDVEGHEAQVLAGANETLERCRPTVLVEIEQRHLAAKPISHVFAQLEQLGYRGGFYRRGVFTDLDDFDVARDQTAWLDQLADAVFDERYANMFLFRHT